jgi:hypothetical protein
VQKEVLPPIFLACFSLAARFSSGTCQVCSHRLASFFAIQQEGYEHSKKEGKCEFRLNDFKEGDTLLLESAGGRTMGWGSHPTEMLLSTIKRLL